ncbi:hypothetical protein FNF27_02715 [Cafeteria roenbergensis]|uniref:SMP-30/Gluconolactonase/LRE-like region domain-containing protein n=1 Tax=Cafeteria roenbergensis TaxID=33653 RepID=A0A5A8ECG6_CAFRO|nr:hypothetical protein FNF29_06532 [Cafeteria roenbergensis]KAA0175633.1 hypothetical protein FNF27_02715 [Cafeteria roenbergensis]|eukprot:KAA0148750.1 hypothetical protein FNF29_06532 [Cafeteria roenbergensis]
MAASSAASGAAAALPAVIEGERVQLVADCRYELGEGALWHDGLGRLLHVDITGCTVGLLDPSSGAVAQTPVPGPVGTVVPVRGSNSTVVVCLDSGVHALDLMTGALTRLASDPETDLPGNRFNDGKCDPHGRLWAGTVTKEDPRTPTAALYRFDAARLGDGPEAELPLRASRVLDGVTISNGIAWPSDGKSMLFIDTPTRRVDRFDWDEASGCISNRRAAFHFPEEDGFGWPDGCTLDSAGRLWTAHFAGGEVSCVDLELRRLVCRVKLPGSVRNATSVAFGGPGLGDLFITTAREGLGAAELAEQPTAGGIFRVRNVGATGVPAAACLLPSRAGACGADSGAEGARAE